MLARDSGFRSATWPVPSRAVSDLLVAGGVFVLLLICFIQVDLTEALFYATREHEDYELDELIAALPALALVTAWFAFRRWREAERLNRSLQRALADVETANERRRSMAEELNQAQKLEAVGQLASGIAHELNNLLQPVVSHTQSILLHEQPNASIRSKLEMILKASGMSREIIRNTLIFAGQSTSQLGLVKVSEELPEILDHARETLPSGVRLQSRIIDHPGQSPINATGLTQVMTNLINNAAAAVESDGNITVELDVQDLSGQRRDGQLLPDGTYFCITVSDDGHGMTESVRSRIFDPFFTTKDIGEGTGLGLAVTYGIIKQWGGSVTVQSEPGKGSRFRVFIPILDRAGAKDAA